MVDISQFTKNVKLNYWQLILLVIIVTIVSPITIDLFKSKVLDNEPSVEEIVQQGQVVIETLRGLTDKYSASRMYLGRFYNGTYFTQGDILARWVVTHQVTTSSVVNLPPEFSEYPVTFLADVFNRVAKENYASYHLIDSSRGIVYNIMRAEDMKSMYMFSVHNPNDEMIAVAVMEFRKERMLSTFEINDIVNTIERLSGFVMYE